MKSKRIEEIESFILDSGSVSFDELIERFDVSLNTLRRDIAFLVQQGTIEKVYGGARAKKSVLLDYELRDDIHQEAKRKIGAAAAQLIHEGDIIFIDSGTTTTHILPFLDKEMKCTILTNNFDIIEYCTHLPKIALYIVGTHYSFNTRSFVGLAVSQGVTAMNVNKSFMAATGVSIENGLTNSDSLEQQIKKELARRAHKIYLLADHTKFNHSTLLTYAPLESVHTVVSDQGISNRFKRFFEEHDIHLLEV